MSHWAILRIDELVDRKVQEIAAALGIEDDLVCVAVDFFDGLEIETVTRNARRFFVLGQERYEACRLTFGVPNQSIAICFRVLGNSRRPTSSTCDDVASVGVGIEDRALAIITRFLRIVDGTLHRTRVVDRLQ